MQFVHLGPGVRDLAFRSQPQRSALVLGDHPVAPPGEVRGGVEPVTASVEDQESLAPAPGGSVHPVLHAVAVLLQQHRAVLRVLDSHHRAITADRHRSSGEGEASYGAVRGFHDHSFLSDETAAEADRTAKSPPAEHQPPQSIGGGSGMVLGGRQERWSPEVERGGQRLTGVVAGLPGGLPTDDQDDAGRAAPQPGDFHDLCADAIGDLTDRGHGMLGQFQVATDGDQLRSGAGGQFGFGRRRCTRGRPSRHFLRDPPPKRPRM